MKIGSFRDKALSDGIFLIKLCSSIEPRIINWDIVKNPAESDEDKQLNSKYAISIARKLGAIIFLVWDDVIECNQKMMLIFMSSLWDIYNQKK
jgi:plastin-1